MADASEAPEELRALECRLALELDAAAAVFTSVASAVEEPTTELIATIADAGRRLRHQALAVQIELVSLTAREGPEGQQLRLVLALMEVAHHATLIANQFDLISEQLIDLDPSARRRENVAGQLTQMAAATGGQLAKAVAAFRDRDLASAQQLDRDDDAVDLLNREICDAAARLGETAQERELSFRQVLIARSLERVADNAVDIAEQAAFVLTAERREFSDASQPRSPRRPRVT